MITLVTVMFTLISSQGYPSLSSLSGYHHTIPEIVNPTSQLSSPKLKTRQYIDLYMSSNNCVCVYFANNVYFRRVGPELVINVAGWW